MSEDIILVRIYKYLDQKKLKHSNLGYKYLMDAIKFAVENPEIQKMGDIYEKVAQLYKTSSSSVQRAIRHAITDKKQTNKEFITKASDEIRFMML